MTFFIERISGVFAIGLCAAMVVGCSVGGASIGTSAMRSRSQSAELTAQSTKATDGNVTFAIRIKPKTKTDRITPKYVSRSTQSLQILTDGTNPVVVNLSSSSPNCSVAIFPDGLSFICTASLSVPTGNHVFTVTTYDLTAAEGNILSTNSTGTVYVKPSGTTTVSLVLQGVVQHVVLVLATTDPPVGTAATIALTAILEDADQNLIVGTTPYANPVTLTTTDVTNGALSKTALSSPADTSGITVHYTGAKLASIVYSATATGLPAATVSMAVLMPGAPAKPQHLYITNSFNNNISVFDTANGNAALPAISGGGLNFPRGITIDASGKLFVANGAGNSVSVFDTTHGNAALPAITCYGLNRPAGVAVDASGKLYVVNGDNSIRVFDTAHGNAALPAITGGGLANPQSVAIDASGKLYVTDGLGFPSYVGVLVFDTAHGNAVLPAITGGGLDDPFGVAVDASGKLYVENDGPYANIAVFDAAHSNDVLPAIGGTFYFTGGVAVDASGKLYVSSVRVPLFNMIGIAIFDTAHGNAALPGITSDVLGLPADIAIH